MTNRYPWAVAAHKELSGVVGNQEDQEIVLGLHQTFDEERANGNCMKDDDLSESEEEEGTSEDMVKPLEWMFTRREVEKGTIEIVYRWPTALLQKIASTYLTRS